MWLHFSPPWSQSERYFQFVVNPGYALNRPSPSWSQGERCSQFMVHETTEYCCTAGHALNSTAGAIPARSAFSASKDRVAVAVYIAHRHKVRYGIVY